MMENVYSMALATDDHEISIFGELISFLSLRYVNYGENAFT